MSSGVVKKVVKNAVTAVDVAISTTTVVAVLAGIATSLAGKRLT